MASNNESVGHYFADFCKQTILHGWHYLSENDGGGGVGGASGPLGEYASSAAGSAYSSATSSPRCPKWQQHRSPSSHHKQQQLHSEACSCCCRCRCHGTTAGRPTTAVTTHVGGYTSTSTTLTPLTSTTPNRSPVAVRKRHSKVTSAIRTFRCAFWTLIVTASVISGAYFLHDNTHEFLNSTVQTTLDGSVALSEVYFPSVVVCNINQIRKSFFAELGFYENDTLVRIMYEDFIKGTVDQDREAAAAAAAAEDALLFDSENIDDDEEDYSSKRRTSDPKRAAFYDVLQKHLKKRRIEIEGSITWLSHQNCDDMFMLSKWNGTTTFDFGNNTRDFGTDYGICCWYTPQLNFSAIPNNNETDWAYWFNSVPKGAKTGKDNGFSLLFDIESFDYGYYDEGSEGLKVAVVHHLDMPIIRQRAFHVAPGTENQIPVSPTLYTITEQALERFTPNERDCYQEREIDLMYLPKSHGYRYEMSNCLFEAAFEKILEECNCVPGFHNQGGDAGEMAYKKYKVCQGAQLTCSNDILNRMGEFNEVHDIVENKTKICLTNCEDQINDLFVTTSTYPNKKTFVEREEYCLLVKKLVVTCQSHKRLPLATEYPNLCPLLEEITPVVDEVCDERLRNRWRTDKLINKTLAKEIETEIHNYARENLAIINIFIKEPYTKRFRKTEKMTRISYIASSGGLLGLCMGFSFVSLAEILYHLCLCCLFIFRSRSKSVKLFKDEFDLSERENGKRRSSSSTGGGSSRRLQHVNCNGRG